VIKRREKAYAWPNIPKCDVTSKYLQLDPADSARGLHNHISPCTLPTD
jgi:hypothetical protein